MDANPSQDWYFLSFFALLSMSPPALETWIILGAPLVAFTLLFILPLLFPRGERAPSRRPWATATVFCGWVTMIVLTIYGKKEPWSPAFSAQPPPVAAIHSEAPSVQRGASLFHQKGCMYCHEILGMGGQRGPDLTDVGVRLARDKLTPRISTSWHNMPSFADVIDREELHSLLDFLETRQPPSTRQKK